MKIPLFFALTSAAMAVTPIVNLPPLDAYSPHTHAAGMLGWTFTVHSTVTVTGVGWFDYGRDGLLSSVQVGLWKAVNGWNSGLTPETIWTGSVGSNSPLSGDFRILALSQELTLMPGQYQLGGLNNGIDSGAYVDTYLNDSVSTDTVSLGMIFFRSPGSYGRADFGPVSDFYLATGVEMGPMLFIVPEPSSAIIGSFGLLALLRRRR